MRELVGLPSGVRGFATDPNPFGMCNAYALSAPGGVYLVEATLSSHADGSFWLEYARAARVLALVVTHWHADHARGVDVLAAEIGAPIWGPARPLESSWRGRVTRVLQDGDEFDGWRVIAAPGHAKEHICLFRADDRALIAGDMVYPDGRPLIPAVGGDARAYVQSLDKLRTLAPRCILPGHGPVQTELPL